MHTATRKIALASFAFALLTSWMVTTEVSAGTDLQVSAINALTLTDCTNTGGAAGAAFTAACGEVGGFTNPDEQNAAGQQSSVEEIGANTQTATDAANGQLTNLAGRTQALRSGALGFVVNGMGQPLGGAAGDVGQGSASKWGAFLTGTHSFGDHDESAREDGFDFDTSGFTGGIDYRLSESAVIGVAGGTSNNDVDFDGRTVAGFATVNGGDIDTNAWHGSIYGTFYAGNFYLDLLGTYGWSDVEMSRKIIFGGTTNAVAKSSTDGETLAGEASVGYQIEAGAMTLTPFGRVSYVDVEIDGFTETGGGGLNLRVEDQDFDSLKSSLGLQGTQAISTSFGVVLPLVRVEWLHEFKNDDESFNASFVNKAVPSALTVRTDDPDEDHVILALGASAVLTQGWQGFAQYETLLFHKSTNNHIFQVGLRRSF